MLQPHTKTALVPPQEGTSLHGILTSFNEVLLPSVMPMFRSLRPIIEARPLTHARRQQPPPRRTSQPRAPAPVAVHNRPRAQPFLRRNALFSLPQAEPPDMMVIDICALAGLMLAQARPPNHARAALPA